MRLRKFDAAISFARAIEENMAGNNWNACARMCPGIAPRLKRSRSAPGRAAGIIGRSVVGEGGSLRAQPGGDGREDQV